MLEGIEGTSTMYLTILIWQWLHINKNLKNATTITMSYVLIVTTLQKKGAVIMPNIDIENRIEQDRWDYSNERNK
jgi:hypothetical protein